MDAGPGHQVAASHQGAASGVSPVSLPGGSRWARRVLLLLSLLLIAGGLIMRFGSSMEASSREFTSGTLIKVGIVLTLGWLAAPQLERLGWHRLKGTGLAIALVVGGLTAVKPRLGAMAAGLLVSGLVVLSLLGWVRGVVLNVSGTAATGEKSRKIQENPTKR